MKYNKDEVKVYILHDTPNAYELEEEEFIEEAEKQGGVYSLQGFTNAFNTGHISTINSRILIKSLHNS